MTAKTRLGLAGVPRRAPFIKQFAPSVGRPGTLRFTKLGAAATPRRRQTFTAKNPAGFSSSRPAGRFTQRGLTGTPMQRRPTFTAKAGNRGVAARTTLTLTPQAIMRVARRHTQLTDLVLSIRPIGAVITFAHRNTVAGRTTLLLSPRASNLHYTRDGAEFAFQGSNSIRLTPFGNVKYRTYRVTSGRTTLTVKPQAAMHYTPAPLRNHQVTGRTTLALLPQSAMTFVDGGIAYGISGRTTLSLVPSGFVQITRQTTHVTHGSCRISLTPQGAITKGTGAPIAYQVSGRTTLTLTPQGTMGLQLGIIEQHAILGSSRFAMIPNARITLARAPTVTPIDLTRPGRRRFIRIFR